MSEANETNNTTPAEEQEVSEDMEVVEVPWEEAKDTFEVRAELIKTKKYLSDILLEHERRKIAILDRLSGLESAMYDSATMIQEKMSLNPTWTYEFKLPTKEGEKAYFIRKED